MNKKKKQKPKQTWFVNSDWSECLENGNASSETEKKTDQWILYDWMYYIGKHWALIPYKTNIFIVNYHCEKNKNDPGFKFNHHII